MEKCKQPGCKGGKIQMLFDWAECPHCNGTGLEPMEVTWKLEARDSQGNVVDSATGSNPISTKGVEYEIDVEFADRDTMNRYLFERLQFDMIYTYIDTGGPFNFSHKKVFDDLCDLCGFLTCANRLCFQGRELDVRQGCYRLDYKYMLIIPTGMPYPEPCYAESWHDVPFYVDTKKPIERIMKLIEDAAAIEEPIKHRCLIIEMEEIDAESR